MFHFNVQGISVPVDVDNPALVALDLIMQLEQVKDQCSVTQAQIVAHVAREKLYEQHPDPEAAADIMGFIKATGLSRTSRVMMHGLGAVIIPFCDEHNIEIDHLLANGQFAKLREAISALRKVIESKDRGCVKRVKEILRFVENASSRNAVRDRMVTKRRYIGDGEVSVVGNVVTLTVVPREGHTPEDIIKKLIRYFDLNGGA